ncbi:MAG: protein kinase [Bryobacterales bacterium]|nr:protein kinase [Bryobacterales bacterium]
MSPERWQLIDRIFNDAVDLPAGEREAFVRREAGGDEEVMREVWSLLEADSTQGVNLDAIVSDAVERADEQHHSGDVGLVLGPYKLVELLGSGGMGSVYKAVRADETFQQAVAIKLVRRGMDSDFILARFRQERQILGNLNHPNIARILDAGSAADGRPYFVMEFVEGLPLLKHCEEGGLSVKQRLELFVQVCAAVQHAHQKLIIHRDLKPSNILVTKEGVPKLLDFGIAKLLAPGDATGEWLTQTTGRMMTPDYASPEQVMGKELTTATDVYSLGALLYLLLAGEKPYRIGGQSLQEMEQAVCTVDPKKPSAAAKDGRRGKELVGDLDNIVLHAMSKEPERRYASAEHLAADIRNYLEGRPVAAREVTFLYRAGKTIRRNKTASIAAALLVASLVGGSFGTYYQMRRAERRFGQVRKMANTFLFDFYDSIASTPGTVQSRALVLRTAREYLDSLSAEASGDASLSMELAQAYLRLGEVEGGALSGNLGNSQLADSLFRKAIELVTPLRRSARSAQLLATAYRRRGDITVYSENLSRALEYYTKGVEILRGSVGKDVESRTLLGSLHLQAARCHARMLRIKESMEHTRQAVEIYEKLQAEGDVPAESRNALATSYGTLGMAAFRSMQLPEALEMHRKSIALRERLVEENPQSPEFRRDLAIAYSNAADVLASPSGPNLGRKAEALELCRKMTALTESNLKADPADRRARFDHAMALMRLGNYLPDAEGVDTMRMSLRMFEQILAGDPKNRRALGMMSYLHQRIGMLLETGDRAAALRHLERSVALNEEGRRVDPEDFDRIIAILSAKKSLAAVLARGGQCGKAVEVLRKLLLEEPGFVAKAPTQIRALMIRPDGLQALGDAQRVCGDHAGAQDSYSQSVAGWEALRGHKDFGKVHEAALEKAAGALGKEERGGGGNCWG